MSIDKGVSERIKLLVDRHKKGNVAQFALSIDVTRSSMSKIYRGEVNPSLSTLQEILKAYPEVDGNWLLTGNDHKLCHTKHENNNAFKEPKKEYGDNAWIELFREQLRVKDIQIAEILKKLPGK